MLKSVFCNIFLAKLKSYSSIFPCKKSIISITFSIFICPGALDSLLAANLPPVALQLIKGFENSAWMQICSIGGMDNMMFDYYSNIDISGEKVVLRKEILNAYQTADTVYQTSQIISNGYSISQLDWKQLEKLVSEVTGGEFFKLVLADTLGEILANYQNYDFMDGIVKNNPTILQNILSDAYGDYSKVTVSQLGTLSLDNVKLSTVMTTMPTIQEKRSKR